MSSIRIDGFSEKLDSTLLVWLSTVENGGDLIRTEIERIVRGGLPGAELEYKLAERTGDYKIAAAMNAGHVKENAELRQQLADNTQAEGERIGCTTCACVDDCEAKPPVCQWWLKEASND